MDKKGSDTELLLIHISDMGCGRDCMAKHEDTLSVDECELK